MKKKTSPCKAVATQQWALIRPVLAAAALLLATLLTTVPGTAAAATVGYTLTLTTRPAFFDPDFGTGVNAGDVFVGRLFFDTVDLSPDGARRRTVLPGGDELTIAGVSFDSLLESTFWSFTTAGGAPACFDTGIGGGCGTGTAQNNFDDPNDPYPSISFTDTFLGTAFDADERSLGFEYAITPIPVPPALLLFASACLGLAGLRRRR